MLRFRKKYNSLPAKLSITTSLIASFIITIIAVYVFLLKSDQVRSSDKHDIELSLSNTALTINKRLSLVESTVQCNLWNINSYITADKSDSVTVALSQILKLNADITGCGVAFNIGNNSEKPHLMYMSRGYDGNERLLTIDDNGNTDQLQWLKPSTKSGLTHWSFPHAQIDDHATKVCTYTIPIFSITDDQRAILFADVPIANVDAIIDHGQSDFVNEAMLFDVNRGLIYSIDYQDKRHADSQGLGPNVSADIKSQLKKRLIDNSHGSFKLEIDGKSNLTFYDMVNNSGWALLYITDFSKISSGLIESTRSLAIIFVIMIVMLFVVLSFVIRRMVRPLQQISDSALEISKGNFDVQLPQVDTHDEMALLHDSFVEMQRSIIKYTKELEESTRQQAFMMGELQVASRIQDDLLPKTFPPFPHRTDIDIHARLIPAKQVGGDLYNYFIHNNRVYFIVADVSGKSVPAALVMAIANNVFNTVSPQKDDPAKIMNELNITTCANNESSGYFITALVGILDLMTGTLQLCNAGHDPSLMIDEDGNVELLKIKPNLPVGVINGYNYVSVTMQLTGNTRLVMYTDGITEAENRERKFFGTPRLIDCIKRNADKELQEIIDNVVNEVNDFANDRESADDITIMVLDYQPSDRQMPHEITVFNDIKEIEKVTRFAQEVADVMGLSDSATIKLNLALEEAVSNIIKYSFVRSGNNIINILASAHKGIITIKIIDTGCPFDPTAVATADTEAPLEHRPVGGLGITLIRSITKEMRYIRQDNHNYLTLTFDFTK